MIKKILPLSAVILTTFCVVSLTYAQSQPSLPYLPTIVYIEGTVSVNASADAWVNAEKGMTLNEGNSIKTADNSYCDIALDQEKKNILSIGPNSEIKLGKDFKQINIPKGRVFAELKNLASGSQFEITTPQAIAGVRGTAWESIVDAIAKFNVKEHTVYVKGLDKEGKLTKENDVVEGYSVSVDPSGFLSELAKLTQDDWDRMNSWSTRIERSLSSSSSKCSALINDYQGASPNLFSQVMDCETGGKNSFASAGEGIVLADTEVNQGITGGDITQTSFIKSIVSQVSDSSPTGGGGEPSPPPPIKPPSHCCPASNPNCSCH